MADRVLIVEDNEALRVGIRLSLEDAGYAVQEASTGEEAVRKLETEPCHVVITDIRLGDLSGVDILKKGEGGQLRDRGESQNRDSHVNRDVPSNSR